VTTLLTKPQSRNLGWVGRALKEASLSPLSVTLLPPQPWVGDAAFGQKLLHHHNIFELYPQHHTFAWIRHVQAVGGDAARRFIRLHILAWLDRYNRFHDDYWDAATTGKRLTNLLIHYGFYGHSASTTFTDTIGVLFAKHSHYLSTILMGLPLNFGHCMALKGLVFASICLKGQHDALPELMGILQTSLQQQLDTDASHQSKCPTYHLFVLEALIEIRALLNSAHLPVPHFLQTTILEMGQILPFIRFGHTHLSPFQGGGMIHPRHLDSVLTLSGGSAQSLMRPLIWQGLGLARLEAGHSLVFVDTALPSALNTKPHYSLLGLAVAIGGEPLITTCGFHPTDKQWQRALRQTVASSSICLGDLDAIRPKAKTTPVVNVTLGRDGQEPILKVLVKSWSGLSGLDVMRTIRLSRDGLTLWGEDTVIGSSGQTFCCRFHTPPRITTTLINNRFVRLILPNGDKWQLNSTDGDITVEPSVFINDNNIIEDSQQIVVKYRSSPYSMRLMWILTVDNT
jgi:uncharacterized heparinase superfamily protein